MDGWERLNSATELLQALYFPVPALSACRACGGKTSLDDNERWMR